MNLYQELGLHERINLKLCASITPHNQAKRYVSNWNQLNVIQKLSKTLEVYSSGNYTDLPYNDRIEKQLNSYYKRRTWKFGIA